MRDEAASWTWKASAGVRAKVACLALLQVVHGLCGVAYALMLRGIVDAAMAGDAAGFWGWAGATVLLVATQLLLRAVARWLEELCRASLENALKLRLFDALLQGGARSARDLMLAAQKQLGRGMTVDGCATVTAIMQISKGNPNAIIRREALETEIKKMKQPGSAFLRTMSDDRAREKYAELANGGNGALLGRSILRDARNHSVRSAQWQVNQSVKSAGRDGVSVEKLAVILAAREMAVNASASAISFFIWFLLSQPFGPAVLRRE